MKLQALVAWFRSWRGFAETSRQMSALQQIITTTLAEKSKSDTELQSARQTLTDLEKRLKEIVTAQKQAIARAEGVNKQLAETLRAAQADLRIANDVTIPGLVAANQVFVDRWDAESRTFVMRNALFKESSE